MSDQPKPKQPPEQSKSPEQNAQGKPEGTKPPADPTAPSKTAEPPKPEGVTPADGSEDTAHGVKVPASQPPAQPAPAKEAPAASEKPAASAPADKLTVAGAVSAAPAPDKPASESASSPASAEKPAPPTTEKPAVPASPPPSAPADKPTVAGAASVTSTAPLEPPPPEPAASAPVDKPQVTQAESAAPPEKSQVGGAASAAPPAASAAAMQQRCPNCGHRNRPGVLICENCGTNLMTGKSSVAGTRDLLREQQEAQDATASAKPGTAPLVDPTDLKAVQSAGSTVFEDNMVLRIEIEGGATPILVYPKQEIIFGRRDPTSGGMPDVDLTPYAGYRMGVSRRHSAIRLQDKRLDVSDLGSSNGTFLNGTRLSAHRPYQVRDGDEIRLGQMVMRVFFQTNTGRK